MTSRRPNLLKQLVLLAALCALALDPSPSPTASAASLAARPSFVLIQTDDQTLSSLSLAMSNTKALIGARGITFANYYVSYPLCCPSRVSLLTGRYAHNHNVRGNIPPNGGYTGFVSRAAGTHNLATWLLRTGYRTIHIGKFLNGYGAEPFDDGREVPPGWSAWHSIVDADASHYYYGYRLSENGRINGPFGDPGSWETREYGVRDENGCPDTPAEGQPCSYVTDRLTRLATEEIFATPRDRPFYLQLDYTAPHGDYRSPAGPEPAPRNYGGFAKSRLPHDGGEGFDEVRVRDKPRFIRRAPRLSEDEKRHYLVYYQKQLEALSAVDLGVVRVIEALGAMHRLRNTYVIFTSDNGFFFGEHRLLGGKFLAYEPATRMPLLMRGPGVRPGSVTEALAANVDIAPTVLRLARARADRQVDGRSLVPFLRKPERRSRRPILFESFVETNDVGAGQRTESAQRAGQATASLLAPPKDYSGIRFGDYKYIAWPSGEQELYNLARDPYELHSLTRVPNFDPIRAFLHRQMLRLIHCAGRRCAEATRDVPPTRKEARRLRSRARRSVPGAAGGGAVVGGVLGSLPGPDTPGRTPLSTRGNR